MTAVMNKFKGIYLFIRAFLKDTKYINHRHRVKVGIKNGFLFFCSMFILVGMSYVILNPVIRFTFSAFMDVQDTFNPLVFLIPINWTLDNMRTALASLEYVDRLVFTMVFVGTITFIQAFICALAGYGFARFRFPGNKLLFAGVIITIVVPSFVVSVPMYLQMHSFDLFGLVTITNSKPMNILNSTSSITLLTLFGMGLKSGLYIYIFRQFFRGLPKEIEEASFIDGGSTFFTFMNIMLPNAIPSIVTVGTFSFVWQYTDLTYSTMFMGSVPTMANRLAALPNAMNQFQTIANPNHSYIITCAGIIAFLLPPVIIYSFLQRYFVEGIERSGIVG
jgi:multiple sugar transport system permease protein